MACDGGFLLRIETERLGTSVQRVERWLARGGVLVGAGLLRDDRFEFDFNS